MQALGLVWRDVDSISPDGHEISTPLKNPVHSRARVTLENWREKHAAAGFAVGRDLPSRALASVLRNLAVYEPVNGAADFRVRVAGTGLVRRYGCDVTGLMLSQLYDARGFRRQQDVMMTVKNDVTVFSDVKLMRAGKMELQYESLLLPVLSPDLSQSWVLGGFFYHDWVR
jgi:hypothetical protein